MDKQSQQYKPDLKTLLKPLIKEAVKECLLEQGILSKIIIEVISGLNGSSILENKQSNLNHLPELRGSVQQKRENKQLDLERLKLKQELEDERELRTKKMMENTGLSKVFDDIKIVKQSPVLKEVVRDIPKQQEEKESEFLLTSEEKKLLTEEKMLKQKKLKEEEREDAKWGASSNMALKGVDPNDPGVNINGILSIIGGKQTWLAHAKLK